MFFVLNQEWYDFRGFANFRKFQGLGQKLQLELILSMEDPSPPLCLPKMDQAYPLRSVFAYCNDHKLDGGEAWEWGYIELQVKLVMPILDTYTSACESNLEIMQFH